MTNDSLMRQIANGDAYAPEFDLPDAARPADVAFADISRRIDMDAKELTRAVEKDPRNRRSGWYAAAAAFGVLVVLLGSVVLLNRSADPEVPPATTPPTTQAAAPTTVATTSTADAIATVSEEDLATIAAYEDAVNSGDAVRMGALLGPEFRHTHQGNEGYFAVAENWILQNQAIVLEGAVVSFTDCVPKGEAVLCLETNSGPLQTAVQGTDWTFQMEFYLADGLVASLHSRDLAAPDVTTIEAAVDRMYAWASPQVAEEVATVLARCNHLDVPPDPEGRGYCGIWFQNWIDAGRP